MRKPSMKKNIILSLVLLTLFLVGCKPHYNEWVEKGKNKYYYDNSGEKVKNQEKQIGNAKYYFDASGKMVSGFQIIDGKKKYYGEDGKLAQGWRRIDGNWYLFDEYDGNMQTGWVNTVGEWYYLDNSGKMLTNQWQGDYYLGPYGRMYVNGMYNIDGKDCYFDGDGKYVRDYETYTMILAWINGMIVMYDSTRNEQELKYVEIHSADPNNIKFSYIFGSNESGFNRMKGTGNVFIDYVVGAVINGNFIRNPNPIYDNADYTNIINLKNNWRSLSSDASKYNFKTTSDEYKRGKRDDCNKGLWLTVEPEYIKTNLRDSELGVMQNYISQDFPLTAIVMTESCMNEIIEIGNILKRYGF